MTAMAGKQDIQAEINAIRNVAKNLLQRLNDLADHIAALPDDGSDSDGTDVVIRPDDAPSVEPAGVAVSDASGDVAAGGSVSIEPQKPASPAGGGLKINLGGGSGESGGGLKIGGDSPAPTAAAPVPSSKEGESLAKRVAAFGDKLAASKQAISSKAVAFLQAAVKNFTSIPESECRSAKAESLWIEIVKRLHVIRNDLNLPGFDTAQQELEAFQKNVLAYLASAHGKELPPPPIKPMPTPPSDFKGQVMGFLIDSMRALASNAPDPDKNRKQIAKLRDMLPKVAGVNSENLENAVALQATTLIHAANEAVGGLDRQLKGIKDLLQSRGFKEMYVGIGEDFGDNYSPSKYTRKKVPATAARNQIVGVIQPGFVNSAGVPVQKAVVAVSEG